MSIQCPGCGTALEPAATSCPTCLRPRSRQEIFAGYGQARNEEAARRGKPLKYIRNLLALGLLAGGGVHLARKEWRSPDHFRMKPDPAPAPPEPPAEIPAPAPAAEAPAPRPAATPEAPREEPREPEKAPSWTVSGKVFWFLDLKPAAGATLVFKDKNGGSSLRSLSAPNGDFKVELPPLEEGGYEVSVFVKSKSRLFIEDTVGPSVRRYSLERRKDEAAEHLRQGGVLHVPLLLPKGETFLQYDLALLP